jgi:hypothetical protein
MLEPIYSIQQQTDLEYSNSSDQCYREYLEKNLIIGFGQLREIEYEKIEFSKPSLVILSPTLEIDEFEITKLTEKLISRLENTKQYRKRYAIIHADENSYIIGGYIFNPINKLRQSPENDYKFNPKTDSFQSIVTLPNMIISFGLATG